MEKKLNKKGVSGIITTVLLIALAFVVVAIVWTIVDNIINKGIGDSNACFGIFDKVSLDSDWTCYNYSSEEFLFKIDIGDLDVDEVLVGVTSEGTSKSFKILKEESQISGLLMYPNRETIIKLPDKDAGLTYILNMAQMGLDGAPTGIQISPIIKGTSCEVSSTIDYIETC